MRNYSIILALVAGIGCSVFGPDRDLVVVSDAASFAFGADAMFTVTNRSNRSHFFTACSAGAPPNPSGKIDRHSVAGWKEIDGFGGFCIAVGVPVEVPLEPGQSLRFGFRLSQASHLGTLRVRLTNGERILAVSNEFTVTN